jgi:hypothetical protein
VIVNEDISARATAEHERNDALNQMRTLTGRLMRAQDDERRRIAQMLHETTAQDLAALKMHLARLTRTGVGLSDADRAALTESIDLAERSMTGIRTLSYLLYPPFLDETGLLSALRWYASGFAERSGIKVDLDLPSTFERLPQEVETTLFRVVQEALINIHHHAESPIALIRLRVDGRRLTIQIGDRGRGMPSDLIAQLPTGGGALGLASPACASDSSSSAACSTSSRAIEGRRCAPKYRFRPTSVIPLRILIVDAHADLHRDKRSLLESPPRWEISDEAPTGREAGHGKASFGAVPNLGDKIPLKVRRFSPV